jgi:hypothetical protein
MAEKKTISAREVVADIKVGMTDEQLMAKHLLSTKGLQSLKNKLLAAGLLTQTQLEGKAGPTTVTPQVDKKALAKNIADAVKSGLPDNEIAKRFGISPNKLTAVYNSLIKAGYLTLDDLNKRPGNFEETVDLAPETVKFPEPPVLPQKETPSQPDETTKDVLLDFGKRFNIPAEDLERLKKASIKEIKEFFDKHKIPISEGKEIIKALGLKVQDFVTDKVIKFREMAQGLVSKSEASPAPPVEETPPAPTVDKPKETTQEPRKALKCPNCKMPQEKEFEICPQCGVIIGKYLEKIESEEPKKKKRSTLKRVVGWIAACIGGFFIFLIIIGVLAGPKENKPVAKVDDSPKVASSEQGTTFEDALARYDPDDGSPYVEDPSSRPSDGTLLLFTGEAVALIKSDILLMSETSETNGHSRSWALKVDKATSYKPREGDRIGVIGRIVDVLQAESEDGTQVGVLLVDPVVMANAPDSVISLSR